MIDTPRTDAAEKHAYQFKDEWTPVCESKFVRQLERELNAANERIKHLRDGIAKQNQTIEQACGKVLGYPWFKDDQKNFPGSTEKDGVCVGDHVAETIVSELASRYTESLARIKRLDGRCQALDDQVSNLLEICRQHGVDVSSQDMINGRRKAKEAKL